MTLQHPITGEVRRNRCFIERIQTLGNPRRHAQFDTGIGVVRRRGEGMCLLAGALYPALWLSQCVIQHHYLMRTEQRVQAQLGLAIEHGRSVTVLG
ncbi:MAG: hypothetical protein BWZ07_02272 [Alphaproteobacteria bacterium ADurb.BinA280]|nr:MAG: hypothetical protein BWZ07_02272 [Alphaproteobacteria bacterium ADurb.BinA280]